MINNDYRKRLDDIEEREHKTFYRVLLCVVFSLIILAEPLTEWVI